MVGRGIMIDDSNDLQVQVRLDNEGMIVSGLVIGDTTHQNQEQIVMAEPGTVKHAPGIGVGASSYIDDEMPDNLFRAIRTQLVADGQAVKHIGINKDNQLIIDAKYNNDDNT